MALEIQKEVRDTGLFLNYHKIEYVIFEKGNDFVEIKIGLYPNMKASRAGKSAVSEYYAKVPFDQYIGTGDIVSTGYSLLKKSADFVGAKDV